MKLGELLAARRKYLDLSQQDVAAAIGTNKSTISRYETGDISNMKRDRIYKLANVLDLSTKVIMNWQDDFFINNWEPDAGAVFCIPWRCPHESPRASQTEIRHMVHPAPPWRR